MGTVDFTNQTIAWGPSTQYDTGGPNAVALDNNGNALEVHVGTGKARFLRDARAEYRNVDRDRLRAVH